MKRREGEKNNEEKEAFFVYFWVNYFSSEVQTSLPKLPVACVYYIYSECQVGYSVGKNSVSKAFGAVKKEVIECSCHHTGEEQVVLKTK